MSAHPLSITVPNLTPAQAQELADFIQSVLIDGRRPVYHAPNRPADIERAAAEIASSHPTPPPPPPVTAPAAAPGTGASVVSAPGGAPTTGNLTAHVDARGVPWDERYHSGTASAPGRNENGSWRRRRGADKKEVDAYEAAHAGSSPNGPAGAPVTTVAAPANGGASAPVVDRNNPASYPPAPPPPPPPPAGAVTYEDFAAQWVRISAAQRVTPELLDWIKASYGGHPTMSDVFKNNPVARTQLYETLRAYDLPAAA